MGGKDLRGKHCFIDHIGNRLCLIAKANRVHRLNYTIYRSIVASSRRNQLG